MKTNTDQVTDRPWRIVETDGSYAVWSIQDETPGSRNNYVIADDIQSEAEAVLIVKAVNEHAALLAVADACERHVKSRCGNDWRKWLEMYRHDVKADDLLLIACITLESLYTLRNQVSK